jgi:general secretion pathway protein B
MSFILDALKKSEIERQRQNVPGLMDAGPAPRRPRFPVWAIALAALLAVNLTVLVIVLARGGWPSLSARPTAETHAAAPAASGAASGVPAPGPGQGPASTAATAPTVSAPSASSPAPLPQSVPASPSVAAPPAADSNPPEHRFSPMDAAPPVYAPEIPAESEPPAGASSAPRTRERDPLLTSSGDKADQEVLPTISELDLTGANALPDLHLDVHVYATKPSERFVYINMRKYQEGNTLAEGPVLERIRRDGVVLNYRGLRFLLPRQ